MTKSNNVIPFPESRIVRRPPNVGTPEDFQEELLRHRIAFIGEIVEDYMILLYNQLGYSGVDIDDEKFNQKDFPFVREALRSSLYRLYGIPHDLHEYVDENVEIDENAARANITVPSANNDNTPGAA